MLIKTARKALTKPAGLLGVAFLFGAALLPAQPARAQAPTYTKLPVDTDADRIALGFKYAPVGLNLVGKNPYQVGLGSYWINTAGDCNGCHSSKTLGNNGAGGAYTTTGNPMQLSPPYSGTPAINTDGYMGGGKTFGSGSAPIVGRNLTPDIHGHPGGLTEQQFIASMRIGHDFAQAHTTTCPSGGPLATTCVPSPENGAVFQTMPWPALAGLTDSDFDAFYQYLTAIPCISNTGSAYPWIVQTCPASGAIHYHSYKYVSGLVLPTN